MIKCVLAPFGLLSGYFGIAAVIRSNIYELRETCEKNPGDTNVCHQYQILHNLFIALSVS